jgi:acetolactate synthase small subunit
MDNVFVFKTNVSSNYDVTKVNSILSKFPQIKRSTIDLRDVDKVLRIEYGNNLEMELIVNKINQLGYYREELPD